MRRIDRYLLSELLIPALVGVVMLLVLLIGNVLYMLLYMVYGGAPLADIGRILLFSLPSVLLQAVPGSLLLGTALSLNRLERDRELLALRMAGIRLTRIISPYLLLGILAAGGIFALQEGVVPKATHQAQLLIYKLTSQAPTAVMQSDVVFRAGTNFVYVRQVDTRSQTLYGVVICRMERGFPTWYTIPMAENRNGRWFFKPDPVTKMAPRGYVFNEKGELAYYLDVIDWGVLDLKQDFWNYITDQRTKPEELTLKELIALRGGLRGASVGMNVSIPLEPKRLDFFIHRRFAVPLAALVGILIAIPLSVHFGRSGGYVGLLLSVVVAFIFIVAQQWTQVLTMRDMLDPVVAAWAPNVLVGLLGFGLLLREE